MIRIYNYNEVDRQTIFSRGSNKPSEEIEKAVDEIIDNVRENGDSAVLDYIEKFDKVRLDSLRVSDEEIEAAAARVDDDFIRTLELAEDNIRGFHSKQKRNSFVISEKDGIVLGQKVMPIENVGIYVPGGTASYPSTVLMNAVPAKIAGVSKIVMVTPCGPDGSIKDEILAAAKTAGVDEVYKVGGAQAVAALAYGTESIPKVDKIVGPGNIFVATAKKKVFGMVSIDMVAGPSEILVVADAASDPRHIAADMLSQAEHDKMASAVLVCDSMELAEKVSEEIEKQLAVLPREEIARVSIDNNGKIIVADDVMKAIDIANEIAPEHLELCLDDPMQYLSAVKNAGSIFMGRNVPEALGDYMAGPNHTLPTMGTARFSGALSVDDFVKCSQFIYYTKDALEVIKDDIVEFAGREGLDGHGRSVAVRFEE